MLPRINICFKLQWIHILIFLFYALIKRYSTVNNSFSSNYVATVSKNLVANDNLLYQLLNEIDVDTLFDDFLFIFVIIWSLIKTNKDIWKENISMYYRYLYLDSFGEAKNQKKIWLEMKKKGRKSYKYNFKKNFKNNNNRVKIEIAG